MKSIFTIAALVATSMLFSSAILYTDGIQEPQKKEKKHIKMIRMEDSGEKIEIDTLISADQVFVWNGDTIDGGKELKWTMKGDDFNFDSLMTFDIDVKDLGKRQMVVVKAGEGDAMKMMNWTTDEGNEMIFAPSAKSHMMVLPDFQKGNVIDLSDPGIISFEKKELKDGKEKITIVREKPSTEKREIRKEIIMHGGDAPMMIHEGQPRVEKRIKVIAGEEGEIQIFEDGEVWDIEKMEEGTKVIEKDGKKVVIKKIKEGDEIKVDVEVEENEEQK